MSDLEIRLAMPNDTVAVTLIQAECFPGQFGDSRMVRSYAENVHADIRHPLRALTPFLVAVHEGEVVGYASSEFWQEATSTFGCTADPESTVLILNFLGVKCDARGQGVGSALVEHLRVLARDLGHRVLVATVSPESADFYRTTGWSVSKPGELTAWVEPEDGATYPKHGTAESRWAIDPLLSIRVQPPTTIHGYTLTAYRATGGGFQSPVWFEQDTEAWKPR